MAMAKSEAKGRGGWQWQCGGGETESSGEEKDREERIVCGQGQLGLGHGPVELSFLVTWHGLADVSAPVDGVPSWLRCHWFAAGYNVEKSVVVDAEREGLEYPIK